MRSLMVPAGGSRIPHLVLVTPCFICKLPGASCTQRSQEQPAICDYTVEFLNILVAAELSIGNPASSPCLVSGLPHMLALSL